MITSYRYTFDHDQSFVNEYDFENKTIIELGASMIPIDNQKPKYFTFDNEKYATVDIFDYPKSKLHFKGNLNSFLLWLNILQHVQKNGKFDYCLISHTLEDLANPLLTCNMLANIAKEGCIIVPSKYMELTKPDENSARGFFHHRWIFNIENNKFIGYPKLNFIDYLKFLDEIANEVNENNKELQIFWKEDILLNIINNDFLGPTNDHTISYYKNLKLD